MEKYIDTEASSWLFLEGDVDWTDDELAELEDELRQIEEDLVYVYEDFKEFSARNTA